MHVYICFNMFLVGESQGWGSLVGCCLWGCTESDTTEVTQQQQQHLYFDIRYVISYIIYIYINIQKTKIMASSPITSWKIDGETMETVSEFIFWDSKITADGDFSHEIKRRLLLGRKVMTNLDNIFKSRDITLPTKVHRGHIWM